MYRWDIGWMQPSILETIDGGTSLRNVSSSSVTAVALDSQDSARIFVFTDF
jgi:hypothetical protein